VDSLNVSARCGCSPKSRQIRPIVERLNPVRAAIDARDQCVALRGVSSSVATITCSTCSTEIDGGRPGRSPSTSPPRDAAEPDEARQPPRAVLIEIAVGAVMECRRLDPTRHADICSTEPGVRSVMSFTWLETS
jgi:hypothetical protein